MSTTVKKPYPVVHLVANRIVEALRPYCDRIEIAGSLRRERPLVGDIEIVAIPRRPVDLFGQPVKGPTSLDIFLDGRNIIFNKRGERYKQFVYGSHKVDLFLPTADTWGSVFTIRTGSWEFSRWLVMSQAAGGAAPEGLVFRDGRLWALGRPIVTPEETDIFSALGLAWVPPVERNVPIAEPLRFEPVWRYEEPELLN